MSKGICDPASMYLLAQAVAALDSAAEAHESGSPSWTMIKDVQEKAEVLLIHDVNNTWPTEDEEHEKLIGIDGTSYVGEDCA